MKISDLKIAAEIAKLGSEIYATLVDKSRSAAEKDRKIAELEKQLAAEKAKQR